METPNPTQVKPPAVFCGLDIAKKSFVAALAQDDPRRAPTAKFANDAHGYAEFLTWLYARAAAGTVIRISMEATGAYWIALATHLKAEARLVVCVHNPQLIKRFMTSFGGRAKTDRIDAALIARFAQERARVAWVPKDTEQARLCELARAYDDYGLALQGFKTRDQQAVHTEVRAHFRATVKYLLVEQKKIREAMLAIVSASVELSAKAELLMTIPGIATLSSAQILAELPFELIGSGRQLAAYAGLVPAIEQSGTSVNKSKLCKMANKHLKRRLYMAAVPAGHYCLELRAFKQRLIAKGKHKLTALVAVAHKLMRIINIVLSKGVPFDSTKLQPVT